MRPITAVFRRQHGIMLPLIQTYTMNERVPPRDLPATPDDIYLDWRVADPDYRREVKDLLPRWGIWGDRQSGAD